MSDTTADRPTYGNWIAQRSPGLWGTGTLAMVILLGGLIVALIAMLAGGLVPALSVAGITALGFTITGTPLGRWAVRGANFTRAKHARDTRWHSGMFSRNRNPQVRLPGHLAQTELMTGRDLLNGRPFAVVRSGGLFTVVARAQADGPWMQDQSQVDAWVANYSLVLAACGAEPALIAAKAISDTAPDPGSRLGAMVRSYRTADSPDLARSVMDQLVSDLPAASSENITYLELTFRGRLINRKGDRSAILTELGRKVPSIITQLTAAGGGSVEMVQPSELPVIVRCAYDPAVQTTLEAAAADGRPAEVDWSDAGPVSASEQWGTYQHDSGVSVSWEMYGAPRSKITELALSGLLAPHSDFRRKRVALVYAPHSPDESTRVAERDSNTANFVAQQGKKKATASAQLVQRAAEQSRQEVAAGAASVRFSLIITATVLHTGDLAQAVSTLESRAAGVPIRVRRCWGSQAAAFAATLPVGFIPTEHTVVSPALREWL